MFQLVSLLSFIFIPATSEKTLSVMYSVLVMSEVHTVENENAFVIVAQPSWRYLQLHRLYIENTYKLQVEASIWKDIFWMWRFFFPSPDSLLPWQQQRIRSKRSWACCGMAVPNKQALSLTVSRVLLLLLPSLCSPHPLPPPPLTSLPSFNIRLLFSRFFVQLVSTHPNHLTDSPFIFVF